MHMPEHTENIKEKKTPPLKNYFEKIESVNNKKRQKKQFHDYKGDGCGCS